MRSVKSLSFSIASFPLRAFVHHIVVLAGEKTLKRLRWPTMTSAQRKQFISLARHRGCHEPPVAPRLASTSQEVCAVPMQIKSPHPYMVIGKAAWDRAGTTTALPAPTSKRKETRCRCKLTPVDKLTNLVSIQCAVLPPRDNQARKSASFSARSASNVFFCHCI
jgi:hypothetical protein